LGEGKAHCGDRTETEDMAQRPKVVFARLLKTFAQIKGFGAWVLVNNVEPYGRLP